ncbi:hypothetical protein QOZ95_004769 [Paenibacillus brasilensis]|uniref:Uncharacterized protein n=1 Tax=Paenibacillus brasilensis TaxID=128574 RepID=A0ABU0L5M2_9BACL|nr:hypothetical protein [Paenibacillus brasilensis]
MVGGKDIFHIVFWIYKFLIDYQYHLQSNGFLLGNGKAAQLFSGPWMFTSG